MLIGHRKADERTGVGDFHGRDAADDLRVRKGVQLLVRAQVKQPVRNIFDHLKRHSRGQNERSDQSGDWRQETMRSRQHRTNLHVESSEPVTNWSPVRKNLTELMSLSWPLTFSPNSNTGSGCRTSHTSATVSQEPETNKFASVGEISADQHSIRDQ
jgi:hypothetical protein